MAAPVVDHVLRVAIFGRKTPSAMEVMMWPRAAFVAPLIVLGANLILVAVPPAPIVVVAPIVLGTALCLRMATAVATIAITLAEGRSSGSQRSRDDEGQDCLDVQDDLQLCRVGTVPIGREDFM
jgi:hypothetical protein